MSSVKSRNTPKKRLTQYGDSNLQERNGFLWCKPCNVQLDFNKKSSIDQHLETKTHLNLVDILSKNKKAKFDNINNKPGDRNEIKKDFANDLMMGFACANIPAHKLENKTLRKCLSKYLRNDVVNAWPSTTTVRKTLPEIHRNEYEKMKSTLNCKKIAILADETTDVEQRDVLNILFLELDCFKGCKPLLAETFFLEVSKI
jgi:hypothetical protein